MVVRNARGGFGLRPGESPIDLPKEVYNAGKPGHHCYCDDQEENLDDTY